MSAPNEPNQPRKTWPDLATAADRLTKRDTGRLGFASGGLWTQYQACNNGRLFSQDLKKVTWNGKEGLDAMQFEVDLEKRLYGGGSGLKEALGGQAQEQAFASGKLSMLNNGVYFAFYQLKQLAPDLPYGAADFPFSGTNPQAKSLNFSDGGWGYNIPQGAKNPDAAWEWLKYTCAGEGNFIRVRHSARVETYYLHLSRFAKGIARGAKVKQGDVIGYVGMTGLATGPHLDYRVTEDGNWLNPLKLKSITPDPLRGESLRQFLAEVERHGRQLSIAPNVVASDAIQPRALF